jgi:hypothetical protein
MEPLVLILTFLFASLLRLAFSTAETSDQWVSFWLIGRQRRRPWITYRARDSIVRGTYGYPSLQHFLISRLPPGKWGLAGRLSNIAYDLLTAGCVYWLTWRISSAIDPDRSIAGLSVPAAATILFLTTPALLPTTSRLLAIKGRAMGMMWVAVYFSALQSLIETGAWWCLPVALAAAQLVILTSMFAMQVALFFSLFLSMYLPSSLPALVIGASIVLGLALPRIGTRPALLFMWNHKLWYLRNYRKGTTASERNRLRDMLQLPAHLFADLKKFIRLSTSKVTPIIGILSAPLALALLIIWLVNAPLRDYVSSRPDLHFLWGITLASIVMFILTSFPQLSSFGQAERYFEYSAYAFCAVGACLIAPWDSALRDSVFWLFLLGHLAAIGCNFAALHLDELWRSEATVPPALEEAMGFCEASLNGGRILTVPCKLGFLLSRRLNRDMRPRFFFYHKFIQRPGDRAFRYYEQDTGGMIEKNKVWMESKEVFRREPMDLAREYDATHFLIDRRHVAGLTRTWGDDPNRIFGPPIFENSGYLMYAVPEALRSSSAAVGASR